MPAEMLLTRQVLTIPYLGCYLSRKGGIDMAKFKVNVELKLNIEGEREDIPLLAANLRQAIAGTLDPTAQVARGELPPAKPVESRTIESDTSKSEEKKTPRRRSKSTETEKTQPFTWVHDAAKWGFPKQEWNTRDKSIWLLHVGGAEVSAKEMTPTEVAVTFSKLFKPAGQLRPSNVSRDLGNARSENPAPVSLDVNTGKFFLTTAGIAAAEQLCRAAKGEPPATS